MSCFFAFCVCCCCCCCCAWKSKGRRQAPWSLVATNPFRLASLLDSRCACVCVCMCVLVEDVKEIHDGDPKGAHSCTIMKASHDGGQGEEEKKEEREREEEEEEELMTKSSTHTHTHTYKIIMPFHSPIYTLTQFCHTPHCTQGQRQDTHGHRQAFSRHPQCCMRTLLTLRMEPPLLLVQQLPQPPLQLLHDPSQPRARPASTTTRR